MSRWIAATSVAGLLGMALLLTQRGGGGAQPDDALTANHVLSPLDIFAASVDEDFARVPSSWTFSFPADHGRHGEYRTESWYIAGTLAGDSRRPLGVQLLLVRIGLRAQPQEHASAWATSEIYAGLFSVSDPSANRLHTGQRLSRAALELAGTTLEPTKIWIEDWRLEEIGVDGEAVDLSMHIATDDLELELELRNRQPLIDANEIFGRNSEQAAPFQFYIQPRLGASGTLRIDGRPIALDGVMSMEHAWGELPLPGGPVASDRFTLYLDDQRQLFFVRTHRADGTGTPATTGLLIGRTGSPVVLSNADIELKSIDYWTSRRTGARYPIRWTLRIPDHDIEAELIPYWDDQEGTGWMDSWAGPVRLQSASATTVGEGFVQLYGYDGP
jgi:predicted secreted hydrolase